MAAATSNESNQKMRGEGEPRSGAARAFDGWRDQLAIDPKERTLFPTIEGHPINPDSLTQQGRRYI